MLRNKRHLGQHVFEEETRNSEHTFSSDLPKSQQTLQLEVQPENQSKGNLDAGVWSCLDPHLRTVVH